MDDMVRANAQGKGEEWTNPKKLPGHYHYLPSIIWLDVNLDYYLLSIIWFDVNMDYYLLSMIWFDVNMDYYLLSIIWFDVNIK